MRRTQLAHQHHIQLPLQLVGDDFSHWNSATWNRQNQGILAPVGLEPLGQASGRFIAITKHGSYTPRHYFS
jgi:hypothetical protein